jgi:hypothetical protein
MKMTLFEGHFARKIRWNGLVQIRFAVGILCRAGCEHEGGEAVPECMRRDVLRDACVLRGLDHGSPDNLLRDGYIGPPVLDHAGE